MKYILRDKEDKYVYTFVHKDYLDTMCEYGYGQEVDYVYTTLSTENSFSEFKVIKIDAEGYFGYLKTKGYKYNDLLFFSIKNIKELKRVIDYEGIKVLEVGDKDKYTIQTTFKKDKYFNILDSLRGIEDLEELITKNNSDIMDLRIRVLSKALIRCENMFDKCDGRVLTDEQRFAMEDIKERLGKLLERVEDIS